MGSVVIGDQRPLDGFAGGPVVPDGGGHGQQPLGDAGVDARGGAAAVAFEVELAFEGVVDRFDPLPDPADGPVAGCLVAAVRADQVQPDPVGDQVLELPARRSPCRRSGSVPARSAPVRAAWPAARRRPRVRRSWGGQAPGHGHPVRGGDQVQLQPPVPARMRGAVAVGRPPGQLGALDRLPRGAARHRGGVDQPHLVVPRRALRGPGDPSPRPAAARPP